MINKLIFLSEDNHKKQRNLDENEIIKQNHKEERHKFSETIQKIIKKLNNDENISREELIIFNRHIYRSHNY